MIEYARFVTVIADSLHVKPTDIGPETRFNEDLGADSLELMGLVLDLESTFDVDIDENLFPKTVKEAYDHVVCIKNNSGGQTNVS